MIFWIAIAALTAAAALSVLVPLARTRRGVVTELSSSETPSDPAAKPELSESDLDRDAEVYRAQLDELERDRERGLIDATAYDAARSEVARRLLAAEEARAKRDETAPGTSKGLRRAASLGAMIFLPVAALGMYLWLGNPDEPDQPLIARLQAPVENQSVDQLVARVERHLSENPQDGKGWEVLAPVYMRLGRLDDAARAFENANRLLGPNAERLSNRGEALTMANNGIISAKAQEAFEAAVKLDPQAIKPRFFLALALSQDGKREDAIAAWTRLLDGADPAAAWVKVAREELGKLTGDAVADLPGPDQKQIEAAGDMNAEDRSAMIENMVSGLESRLREEGGSADEWVRLLRAQMVLGRRDEALEALKLARASFAENHADLAKINAAASDFGL